LCYYPLILSFPFPAWDWDPSTSASPTPVVGITGMCHHAQLLKILS
jgi:hypothetical protein